MHVSFVSNIKVLLFGILVGCVVFLKMSPLAWLNETDSPLSESERGLFSYALHAAATTCNKSTLPLSQNHQYIAQSYICSACAFCNSRSAMHIHQVVTEVNPEVYSCTTNE